jgi:ketosteroid isomerase-like protein
LAVHLDGSSSLLLKPKEETVMTHLNETLLRQTYDAVGQGNVEALLNVLTDDVVWEDSSLGPLSGTYQGKQAVATFFGEMFEVYAGTLRLDVVDIVANDDHGVVLTREQGETSSEAISWRGAHIWTFCEGRRTEFVAVNDGAYNRFWASRSAVN